MDHLSCPNNSRYQITALDSFSQSLFGEPFDSANTGVLVTLQHACLASTDHTPRDSQAGSWHAERIADRAPQTDAGSTASHATLFPIGWPKRHELQSCRGWHP